MPHWKSESRKSSDEATPLVIVIDNGHPGTAKILPALYEFIFSSKRFIDVQTLYEEVFERVPLSLVRYEWFLEHASAARSQIYAIVRRIVEIIIAFVLAILTAVITPFVALAIKLEDRGPVFIIQRRIGKGGKVVLLPKFRSMKSSDTGKWLEANDNRVTRVGYFIRKTRIDELPQIFSVLKGDLSLIGPRPDIENLGRDLEKQLPFYRTRHLGRTRSFRLGADKTGTAASVDRRNASALVVRPVLCERTARSYSI
jgi:lipopolysaccharide/colanic/teichoic acid biosynthesis glycosyltransferase